MPTVTDRELNLLDKIDSWRIAASEATDDIGGWRTMPADKPTWDLPLDRIETAHIATEAAAFGVTVAASMVRLADATHSWRESRSAAGLPPQTDLLAWLDDALAGLAIVTDKITRGGNADGPPISLDKIDVAILSKLAARPTYTHTLDDLRLNRNTAVAHTKKLLRQGLIVRPDDSNHGVIITEKGKQALSQAIPQA